MGIESEMGVEVSRELETAICNLIAEIKVNVFGIPEDLILPERVYETAFAAGVLTYDSHGSRVARETMTKVLCSMLEKAKA